MCYLVVVQSYAASGSKPSKLVYSMVIITRLLLAESCCPITVAFKNNRLINMSFDNLPVVGKQIIIPPRLNR